MERSSPSRRDGYLLHHHKGPSLGPTHLRQALPAAGARQRCNLMVSPGFHRDGWQRSSFMVTRSGRAAPLPSLLSCQLYCTRLPEANTTDGVVRPFDFQTISAPLNRETDLTGFIGFQVKALFAFHQVFLVKLGFPAFIFLTSSSNSRDVRGSSVPEGPQPPCAHPERWRKRYQMRPDSSSSTIG